MNYTLWFDQITKDDIGRVGGKGANLGEMFGAGIPVPFGFVVTAQTYFKFLESTKLRFKIKDTLKLLDHKDPRSLETISKTVQKLILSVPMPKEIAMEIMEAYMQLESRTRKKSGFWEGLTSFLKEPLVAVRSSATAEDLPGASFAGQQDTYLNVKGEASLIKKVQEAWASLFTPRAVFYREEQKYDHMKVGIAVVVQLMVASEISGVMFTIDPVSSDKKTMVVEAILGLGEFIVQGIVTPDHFELNKDTLEITNRKISNQHKMLIKKGTENAEVKLTHAQGSKQKVTDEMVQTVAKLGKRLEKHYFFPQDVEWAVEKGNVYIVQTRPITTVKTAKNVTSDQKREDLAQLSHMKLLLTGDPASPGIVSGPVKIIHSASEIDKVLSGDVLVTVQTNPDFVPAMKRAIAIVTEKGGRTSHAAIVSRELGIPAVVGTPGATRILSKEKTVTVDGRKGQVYQGGLSAQQKILIAKSTEKKQGPEIKTATNVYVNLASPGRVEEVAKMNVNGVGLLRAEFMIADIGTHPKKLIKEGKSHVFIEKLANDLLVFAKAFNPRPVVYRATDFKTNEYRNLKGGGDFEPEESNPMLGYRGAYRYMSDPKVFELELAAIKMVRNKHGFKNLWLMLPFVRTVNELVEVKKIIASSGLSRSSNFKLWMMVEIPSNVILLDQFCEAGIDGVSIGSNDLTMLILGTDRDNSEVASEFDERNDAVTWAFEKVIKTAHKYGVTSSMCGQAPSDYPELVEKLVEWGITSMSVNPDVVDAVRETIHRAELKLVSKKR
ncbi:phosphoenolpyruvate synthase [Candidatus Gottesmanbacteria bacterium RIFCSPHIGHO2_02_FULL_39_11]|uniref:Phosphoenolpyruvate synthase n=1 Tax=Candidatus Gottesmanbacteria bacterium RIFCSPHIGHO2_02_FULL_39_11 TaxID=1798382 RepID=A0A1F5ZNP8_9BACT|nr:MAG: phosphoenolpyruvate synthase [Candidatus Gottesmanbacteria bacterium RIFCSPHIGHO2_02_FULL_39_11]